MATTAVAVALTIGAGGESRAVAQTIVWQGSTSDDYGNATNWTPQIVPNTPAFSAAFDTSGSGTVTLSAAVNPNGWTFDPTAQSFTITGNSVAFGATGLVDNAATDQTISTTITGGSVTLAGEGNLFLNGANTYAGGTEVAAGALVVGGDVTVRSGQTQSAGTGAIDLNGGTLVGYSASGYPPGDTRTLGNAITVNMGGGTITSNGPTFVLTGNITNADTTQTTPGSGGPLSFTNAGDDNIVVVLSGANTYTGGTVVAGPLELQAGSTTAFSPSSPFVVNSALDLNGFDNTIAALSGTADAQITLGGATLSIVGVLVDAAGTGAGSGIADFAGVIYGPGKVAVTGSPTKGGVVELSGDNQYDRGTTIAGGSAVVVGNNGALGSGMVTMQPGGAVLAFNNTASFTIGNDIGVSTGSAIAAYAGAAGEAYSQTVAGTITDADPATPGQLVKQGDGILALTGANTYSGGTVLSDGTLRLGGGGTVGTPGAIVSSAIGTGTLTLDGGTLQSALPSLTVANAVAVNATGGTIDTDSGNVIAFTGAIANGDATTGALTVANTDTTSGAVVLSGANTYAGPTIVDGATGTSAAAVLQAGSTTGFSARSAFTVDGVLDLAGFSNTIAALSGGGQVTNTGAAAATLTIANGTGTAAVFAGTVTDGPTQRTALAVVGGTQFLAGTNSYTGGTTIGPDGALVLGAGGTTGSIVGDVSNNGVLGFARSDSATFAGQISGGGAVLQLGDGTTILTADNSYTGGTMINAGVLQLGNGGTTGAVTGAIDDDSLLVFDRSDIVTYAGVISGSGSVVQAGSGTLVLTGESGFTGPAIVAAGTLQVDGSIVAPALVQSGATLDGSGVVGGVVVGDGGTLGAGSASTIGLLYVDGNVTFQAGSAYAVKIVSANQNDIVLASGQADLAGGTVRVLASGAGFAADTRYLILNAREGIASHFAGVSSNFAFLHPTLLYDANNVFLDVGNPLFTNSGNLNPTESAVAAALQSGYSATGNAGSGLLAAAAVLSTAQAPAALAQLSGQATSATQEVSFADGKLFMSAVNDQSQAWLRGVSTGNEIVLQAKPLSYAATGAGPAAAAIAALDAPAIAPTRTWRAWGAGYGDEVTLKGLDGGLLDLEHRTAGGGFGADYQINPQLLAGFGVGGSTSSFSVPNSLTSGTLDAGHLGIYAAGRFANVYATAALTYAHAENATTRLVTDLGTPGTERGDFGSDQVAASFEAGYRYDAGAYAVTPFATAAFYDTFQGAYPEKGTGPYALSFGARQSSSVPISLGAQIDGRFTLANGMVVEPYLRAAYSHETTQQRAIDAFFTDVPLSFFTASGIVADADVADIKAGAHLYVTPSTSLFASFEAVASPRTQGFAGMAGFNMLIGGSEAKPVATDASGADVPVTPWTVSVTPDLRVDSFRSSRGYPATSASTGGSGSQIYISNVVQASGTILPDTQLTLLAKPGVLYGHQGSAGLNGTVATPADTTASATFTYLGIDGVQPFLSVNFNLPSGRTILKGSDANARLDPDFVTVGTYGEGFNIGPTLGVNLPFSQELTASFSVGYTHHGAYDKEGPIDPYTFAQGTQLFAPGQDLTFSGNVGYVSGAFNTQASFSFAMSGITYTDGTPTYQSGDRYIGSLTEAYTWDPKDITTFTGTLAYTDRNTVLNTSLPAFVAEAFDSNNFVTRLRLTHSFIADKWTYGPLLGFVYRDRNGYDAEATQFVPAKTIVSGGASAAYAFDDTTSITASVEYFHSDELRNPSTAVGRVVADGLHFGLTGAYTF